MESEGELVAEVSCAASAWTDEEESDEKVSESNRLGQRSEPVFVLALDRMGLER